MDPVKGKFGKQIVNSIWTRFRPTIVLVTALCSLITSVGLAQDAVPSEILKRTLFIKAGDQGGTAFTLDHAGKLYLVTAKHVVAGLPQSGATIQVWRENGWTDYKTVRTLFPPSDKVDIAVLETNEKVSSPYNITPPQEKEGTTFGQQVWFLGYPWGLGSRLSNGQLALPFIKRGTMSAIDATDPNAVILYIDGFNNPGFSGGPIVYWDFGSHAYRIFGVVKGYKEDTAKVVVNGVHVDTQLLVNSGILVGYNISHAIQAIEQGSKRP